MPSLFIAGKSDWGVYQNPGDFERMRKTACKRYKGKSFQSLKGRGFKANYYETETGEAYWISGPRRDGLDRLYGKSALVVEIDADVREEYWTEIRKQPEQKTKSHT